MPLSTNDLTSFFLPDEAGGASPLRFHQGVVIAWNPDTGENTVSAAGTQFSDLPLLDSSDIVTIRPGSTVSILVYRNSWFILGALAVPGTDVISTRSAIGFNTGITASAFGQAQATGTDSGYVASGNGVTFTTFSGRWLIMLTAQVELSGPRSAARFSYSAAGVQNVTASNDRAALVLDPGGTSGILQTVCFSTTHEGSPGEITVTPEFRLTAGPGFPTASTWTNRSVIVHSF